MNLRRNKTLSAIALILILTFSALMAFIPAANAHTPAWNVPTYAYVNAAPSPIGVGQTALIVMWIDKIPPTAGGTGGLRWTNFTLTITAPDGTITHLGPFISADTSSTNTFFAPTQTGTYTILFNFPGQVSTLTGPPGATGFPPSIGTTTAAQIATVGDFYMASSATTTLTVQQQPITLPQEPPLPTSYNNYWARPISGNNPSWVSIASNYLGSGSGSIVSNFQPNGTSPISSHVVWVKQLALGGIAGTPSDNSGQPQTWFLPGPSYEAKFPNEVIIDGRLYYPVPLGDNPTGGGYQCVDLQTGKELWWINNTYSYMATIASYPTAMFAPTVVVPTFGQLYQYVSPNQWGAEAYLWATFTNQTTGQLTWRAIDPNTGAWLFDLVNVPAGGVATLGNGTVVTLDATYGAGSTAYGSNGEILKFFVGNNGQWIAEWNNTAATGELLTPPTVLNSTGGIVSGGTNAWQWKPVWKYIDASAAWSWNVTLPTALPALSAIQFVSPDNFMLLLGNGTFTAFSSPALYTGATMYMISLKPGTIGQLLWSKYIPPPDGNLTLSFVRADPTAGVFVLGLRETMQFVGYSLQTGNQVWGPLPPVGSQNAFQYYGSAFIQGPFGYAAYGNLYWGGYGGDVYCINDATGQIKWVYNGTAQGLLGPYTKYPLFIATIANGMVYCGEGTHGNGAYAAGGTPYDSIKCLNATTGELMWSLYSWDGPTPVFAIADGYLTEYNMFDGRIYCIGQGQTATTVSAPQTAVTEGNSVLITGTVMDQSPGTVNGNGPGTAGNGATPCISDRSMDQWMEYLYQQQAMPTNATGVPVTLTALDPNGNTQNIGTVTSDTTGGYAIAWTPPVPGVYRITATFAGSNSYFRSSSETHIDRIQSGSGTTRADADTNSNVTANGRTNSRTNSIASGHHDSCSSRQAAQAYRQFTLPSQ